MSAVRAHCQPFLPGAFGPRTLRRACKIPFHSMILKICLKISLRFFFLPIFIYRDRDLILGRGFNCWEHFSNEQLGRSSGIPLHAQISMYAIRYGNNADENIEKKERRISITSVACFNHRNIEDVSQIFYRYNFENKCRVIILVG